MRTPLEALVSKTVIDAVIQHSPGLREAIRDALDKGASPKEIRRRYCKPSIRQRNHRGTALAVEWLVDEWEREHGRKGEDESIDD